jgi:hypothetical protein
MPFLKKKGIFFELKNINSQQKTIKFNNFKTF